MPINIPPLNSDAWGLSDLGLGGQDSMSNSAGDPNQKMVLDDLLAESKALKSPQAQALAIEQAQAELAGQNPGFLEQLNSPRGIVNGLMTVAALAAGQPMLAAGIGLKTVGRMEQMQAEKKALLAKQREDLNEQHDKALERISTQQNRIVQMLTANPDLFRNPITGEQVIDETSLGLLATGRPIPLSVESKQKLASITEADKRWWELAESRLEKATTDQDREQIIRAMERKQGWVFPDNLRSAMSREIDGEYMQNLNMEAWKTLMDPKAGQTGPDAIQRAIEAGDFPDKLYKYVQEIEWTDTSGGGSAVNDKMFTLLDELNAYVHDPNIPLEERLKLAADPERLAQTVFAGRPGDLAFLQSKVSPLYPWMSGEDAWRIYNGTGTKRRSIAEMTGLPDYLSKTPEQQAEADREAFNAAAAQADNARRTAALQASKEQRARGIQMLTTAFGKTKSTDFYLQVLDLAARRAAEAIGPEGTAADYDAAYTREISKAIAYIQRKQTQGQ